MLALDDGRDEEVEFAAVAKPSEWDTKTYELTWQPVIRALVTPDIAKSHPMRQQHRFFSRQNSLFAGIAESAEQVRAARPKAANDHPLFASNSFAPQ